MAAIESFFEFGKDVKRTIVNRELMMLYGSDVTGYLPPLSSQEPSKSSSSPLQAPANAWSCSNPAMRQLANPKRRGMRQSGVIPGGSRRQRISVEDPRRPHTAYCDHVKSVLNTHLDHVERPYTTAGKIESLSDSECYSAPYRVLRESRDADCLIVPKLTLQRDRPDSGQSDFLQLDNGSTYSRSGSPVPTPSGLRRPRFGTSRINAKKKQSKDEREEQSPNSYLQWNEKITRVLQGDVTGEKDRDLPKAVYIYICAPTQDFSAERTVLVEQAFPSLRHYCSQQGVELKIVDPRRGAIHTDNYDLHLRELQKCNYNSLGPFFMLFLGNRYGLYTPPANIASSEFELIRKIAVDSKLPMAELLDKVYTENTNCLPACFVLQWTDNVSADDLHELAKTISTSTKLLVQLDKMGVERLPFYNAKSDVAEEARQALEMIRSSGHSASGRAMCVFRNIVGMGEEHSGDVSQYTDTLEAASELQDKLDMLKTDFEKAVGGHRIKKYDVNWRPGGINVKDDLHREYLDKMALEFVADVKKVIQVNIQQSEVSHRHHTLYSEVVQHTQTCTRHVSTFCGRKELLSCVQDYILDKNRCTKPLVIHGPPDSGKSALLSMVISLLPHWLKGDCVSIFRYLGSTTESNDLVKLLCSICLQISAVYSLEPPPPPHRTSPNLLLHYLLHHLDQVSKHNQEKRPLVILLDGLDAMNLSYRAESLFWLPNTCPPGVSIIVTVNTECTFIMDRLYKYVGRMDNFISVGSMSVEETHNIATKCLQVSNRSLTTDQRGSLFDILTQCPGPMFGQLMATLAIQWDSWTEVSRETLPGDENDAISRLLYSLEDKFGPHLVKRTLSALSLLEHGLSETELQDVVAVDVTSVREVIRVYGLSTIDTMGLLSTFISLIVYKLEPLLERKFIDGRILLKWRSKNLRMACFQKYMGCTLLDEDVNIVTVQHLANDMLELFSQDAGMCKTTQISKTASMLQYDCEALPQPLIPSNLHKLDIMPTLVKHSRHCEDIVEHLKQRCLTNFDWLLAKLAGLSVEQTLDDFRLLPQKDCDTRIIYDVLVLTRPALRLDASSLPVQIVGCIPPVESESEENPAMKLIQDAERWIQQATAPLLQPIFCCFPSPINPCKNDIMGCAGVMTLDPSGQLAVVKNKDGYIELWDMDYGEKSVSLDVRYDKVTPNVIVSDQKILSIVDMKIQIWEIESGMVEAELAPGPFVKENTTAYNFFCNTKHFEHVGVMTSDDEFNQNITILDPQNKKLIYKITGFNVKDEFFPQSAVITSDKNVLAFVNARSQVIDDKSVDIVKLNVHDLAVGQKRSIITCGEKIFYKLLLKGNDQVVISWSDSSFDVYDVINCTHFWHLPAPRPALLICDCHFTQDGYMVYMTNSQERDRNDSTLTYALWFWNTEDNTCGQLLEHKYRHRERSPDKLVIIEELHVALVAASGPATVVIWDLPTATCIHTLQCHTDTMDTLIKSNTDYNQFYTSSSGEVVTKLWDIYHILANFKQPADVNNTDSSQVQKRIPLPEISASESILKRPGSRSKSAKKSRVRFSEDISVHNPKDELELEDEKISPTEASEGMTELVLSKDSRWMVCGGQKKLPVVWDLETGRPKRWVRPHLRRLVGVSWLGLAHHDTIILAMCEHEELASAATNQRAYLYQVWDFASGEPLFVEDDEQRTGAVCSVVSDTERAVLATVKMTGQKDSSNTELIFRVIHVRTHVIQCEVSYTPGVLPTSITLTEDCMYAITASEKPNSRWSTCTVFCLDPKADPRPVPHVYQFQQGTKYHEYQATMNVLMGRGLAVAAGLHGDLQLWDLLSGEYEGNLCQDPSVGDTRNPNLHNHGGKKIVHMATTRGGDGRYLLCGSMDCTTSLWDVENECRLHLYGGHIEEISQVLLSADNNLLVTAAADRTVCVWHFGVTDKPLYRLYIHATASKLVLSDDNSILAVVGGNKNQPNRLMTFRLRNMPVNEASQPGGIAKSNGHS